MRRQDTWLGLADRLCMDRTVVVAVCAFLNMRRDCDWIAYELGLSIDTVQRIHASAKPLLRQSRREVKAPAGDRECAYCGTRHELTRDHIIPRSRGGTDDPSNLVWACRNCNAAKGNRTPQEWLCA